MQGLLTSGRARYASGHGVGRMGGLHSGSDLGQKFKGRPSADLNKQNDNASLTL